MAERKYFPMHESRQYFEENNLESDIFEIRTYLTKTYKILGSKKARGICKGLIINTLEKKGLLDDFIKKYWKNGATEEGKRIINRAKNKYFEYEENGGNGIFIKNTPEINNSFAYETDLRNFLEKNLYLIEEGLELYKDENGKNGIEFRIDNNNKRIDILAIDKNKYYVIIELKVDQGYEKVVGQCQYYKNKIKELFKTDKVRVIIIARKITDYLKMAISDMNGYELFEYELNFKIKRI